MVKSALVNVVRDADVCANEDAEFKRIKESIDGWAQAQRSGVRGAPRTATNAMGTEENRNTSKRQNI